MCCVYRLQFRDCKQFCGAHNFPNKLNCHQSDAHKHPKPRNSMGSVEAAEKNSNKCFVFVGRSQRLPVDSVAIATAVIKISSNAQVPHCACI